MKSLLVFVIFGLVPFLVGSKKAKSKQKPKDKPCDPEWKTSILEPREIAFSSKNPANTIWPYEWSYIKAKMRPTNVKCGKFEMQIVDIPLRRLIHQNDEWTLMGIGNHYLSKKTKKLKSNKYTDSVESQMDSTKKRNNNDFTSDIPVHLLRIKPLWYTRNPIRKRIIKQRIKSFCKQFKDTSSRLNIFKKNIQYDRCLIEKKDMYNIGSKAVKRIFNLKWTNGIFSRKSKTYRIKIKNEFIQNMHPGKNGVGCINKDNNIYTAYKSFQYLLKITKIKKIDPNKFKNDDVDIEDNENEFYLQQKKIEEKTNIKLSVVPILHYSQYDSTKCGVKCEEELNKKYGGKYLFDHEFVKFIGVESSERLGKVNMKFKSEYVHSLSINDDSIPNLIKKKKSIQLKLTVDRYCGFGGFCASKYRSMFTSDGWDIFHGEQIQFQFNILSNPKHFKIMSYQHPIISALFGSNTIVFGKGMRKKQMFIKPTNKVEYGRKYQFSYNLITTSVWHKWYLYYSKIFESQKLKSKSTNKNQKDKSSTKGGGNCKTNSIYAPKRPLLGCNWGPLKTQYQQEWYVEMPESGYFKHALFDQWKFSRMNVGERKCGKIEAIMEEWPIDGNEYYIKLLLKYLGSEGGIIFVNEEDQILRYPEKTTPGEINIPFRKYIKKWCIEGIAPGGYIMTFNPYGSLLNLFPNPPSQMQINVARGRIFTIKVSSEVDGTTVFNNKWSDEYYVLIDKLPDTDKYETDIVLTPKNDNVQFSPTKFIWSPNTPLTERKQRKYFKFRPLLECAYSGVTIHIQWEITGMVSKVVPNPIPPTIIKVIEHIQTNGCSSDQDTENAESDDGFIQLDSQNLNIDNINLTKKANTTKYTNSINNKMEAKTNQHNTLLTFTTSLIILCCFGLIIIGLCSFGLLGNDEEFELLVSNKLKKAIILKQQQQLISRMNATTNGADFVDDHYERNVNQRHRLLNQNNLYPF